MNKTRIPLSVVIITRNEERNLPRTLAPLGFAHEILVVDSFSTDRTVELARSLGARVLEHEFLGDGPQKKWAAAQAAHDWLLCLDADEVIDEELSASVRALLDGDEPPCAAYQFRYLTVFMGQPLRHGKESRRCHVRLFDRRRAGWTEATVHGTVVTDGEIGLLPGTVWHYTVRDLSDSVNRMNSYSSYGAAEAVKRGKQRGALALLFTPPLQFLRHYLLYQNFRNGIPGLAWSFMNAVGSTMKYLKARELEASGAPRLPPAPPVRPPA